MTESFERAIQQDAARKPEQHVLQLYVAGGSRNSLHAIANLKRICDRYLPGKYQLRIIDIQQNQTEVMVRQIVAVPTLDKLAPQPSVRIIGDLSDIQRVLKCLGIKATDAEEQQK